ncbi:MAG: PQQ-binding-like beta-propeller repeat protein [Deltaproteobacteria bacterium]|nr:PQQ-binding-like beta-propeller repeat protein [Deltaproteobacteria bacterium]
MHPGPIDVPLKKTWKRSVRTFYQRFFKLSVPDTSSSPIVYDNILYAGSPGNRFFAFDLTSGKTVWKFKPKSPVNGAPTVDGDKVCFGTVNTVFHCLDRKSGAELWKMDAKAEILAAPVIAEGRVFMLSEDNRLYALDAATGKKLWGASSPSGETVLPRLVNSPAYADGRLYVMFSDGYLAALDASTGRELWQARSTGNYLADRGARHAPLLGGSMVYAIDYGGYVTAYDAISGEKKIRYDITGVSDFAIKDGVFYAATNERMTAMTASTGEVLWISDMPKDSTVSFLAMSGNHIFVFRNAKHRPLGIKRLEKDVSYITVYSATDGTVVWEKKFGTYMLSEPALFNGGAAFIDRKGRLYVFKAPV